MRLHYRLHRLNDSCVCLCALLSQYQLHISYCRFQQSTAAAELPFQASHLATHAARHTSCEIDANTRDVTVYEF